MFVLLQIDYFNNKVICDLVEIPHHGIISILDEACLNVGKVSFITTTIPFGHHASKKLKLVGLCNFMTGDGHDVLGGYGLKAEEERFLHVTREDSVGSNS